jgi:dTDP-4-dehydrorhamnose 3,5-epimerase
MTRTPPADVQDGLTAFASSRKTGVIHDVMIKPLVLHADARGHFAEQIKRGDTLADGRSFAPEQPFAQMSRTVSYARGGNPPELIKAFHWHAKQWDYWDIVSGDARIVLADIRPESPTVGTVQIIFAGERAPKVVAIPPRVAHGYQVLSLRDVVLCYYVTEPYDADEPDESRIPYDDPRIGFDWSVENG